MKNTKLLRSYVQRSATNTMPDRPTVIRCNRPCALDDDAVFDRISRPGHVRVFFIYFSWRKKKFKKNTNSPPEDNGPATKSENNYIGSGAVTAGSRPLLIITE